MSAPNFIVTQYDWESDEAFRIRFEKTQKEFQEKEDKDWRDRMEINKKMWGLMKQNPTGPYYGFVPVDTKKYFDIYITLNPPGWTTPTEE